MAWSERRKERSDEALWILRLLCSSLSYLVAFSPRFLIAGGTRSQANYSENPVQVWNGERRERERVGKEEEAKEAKDIF